MLSKIIDIIQDPMKATYATITGLATGYTPNIVNAVEQTSRSNFDTYFQHSVWTITILVGLTALITWVQKQHDRYKNRKKSKYTKIE